MPGYPWTAPDSISKHRATGAPWQLVACPSATVVACRAQPQQEYVLEYLVERKRVDDLASSIRDGRFFKQKAAMRRCGCRCLLYLVEGLPEGAPCPKP